MHVTLRQLRVFLEVARQGSFSRAAGTLHLSQPAISRQIRELESALGLRLFDRGAHAVRLTPAGRLLRPRADQLDEILHTTVAEVQGACGGVTATVRIGLPSERLVPLLAPGLAWCQQRHPAVSVLLHHGVEIDGLGPGALPRLDFLVASGPVPGPCWHHRVAASGPLHLVTGAAEGRARGATDPEFLRGRSWWLLRDAPPGRPALEAWLARHAPGAASIHEVQTPQEACRQLARTAGLGLWPAWQGPARGGPLQILPPPLAGADQIVLLHPASVELSPPARLIWVALARYLTARLRPPRSIRVNAD